MTMVGWLSIKVQRRYVGNCLGMTQLKTCKKGDENVNFEKISANFVGPKIVMRLNIKMQKTKLKFAKEPC